MKDHKNFKFDELSVPVTPPVAELEVSETNNVIVLPIVIVILFAPVVYRAA